MCTYRANHEGHRGSRTVSLTPIHVEVVDDVTLRISSTSRSYTAAAAVLPTATWSAVRNPDDESEKIPGTLWWYCAVYIISGREGRDLFNFTARIPARYEERA